MVPARVCICCWLERGRGQRRSRSAPLDAAADECEHRRRPKVPLVLHSQVCHRYLLVGYHRFVVACSVGRSVGPSVHPSLCCCRSFCACEQPGAEHGHHPSAATPPQEQHVPVTTRVQRTSTAACRYPPAAAQSSLLAAWPYLECTCQTAVLRRCHAVVAP